MKRLFYLLTISVLIYACKKNQELTAQQIIDKAIESSATNKLINASLAFDFRGKHYEAVRKNGLYKLIREFKEDTILIKDVLKNDGFTRYKNEIKVNLPDSLASQYGESVNSVHYFSKLPLGLNDAAVIKKRMSNVNIKGKEYYKIKITFQQDGGGKDFEDVFIYWFSKETFQLTYLAYSFHVNGGGVRFREVSQVQNSNGISFFNYNNFKPKNLSQKIETIDKAYEENALIKVSEINMENIRVSF